MVKLPTVLAAALAALALHAPVRADDYPSKPITIVVNFPAGGLTDVSARARREPV